jgi:hypothetical protein
MLETIGLNPHVVIDINNLFMIVLLVAGSLSILLIGLALYQKRHDNFETNIFVTALFNLFAISLVGAVAGYSGGLSRVSAVGEIIPAAMSIIGGLSIYLFGVKKVEGGFVPIAVIAFAAALFIGFSEGANKRTQAANFALIQSKCFDLFMDPITLSPTVLALADERFGPPCKSVMGATFDSATGK